MRCSRVVGRAASSCSARGLYGAASAAPRTAPTPRWLISTAVAVLAIAQATAAHRQAVARPWRLSARRVPRTSRILGRSRPPQTQTQTRAQARREGRAEARTAGPRDRLPTNARGPDLQG